MPRRANDVLGDSVMAEARWVVDDLIVFHDSRLRFREATNRELMGRKHEGLRRAFRRRRYSDGPPRAPPSVTGKDGVYP